MGKVLFSSSSRRESAACLFSSSSLDVNCGVERKGFVEFHSLYTCSSWFDVDVDVDVAAQSPKRSNDY